MAISKINHSGWENNLLLANDHAELVITLDVGPRILSYKAVGGSDNVFKNYDAQLGGSGESEWQIRGGHRLWVAPENEKLSYVPDNEPVAHEILGDHSVRLTNRGVAPWHIKKELTVTLDADSSKVTVHHKLTNESDQPAEIASWGLTVMAPGGLEIIPLPPLGQHPRDLLPNRAMIAWPYTDLGDVRWHFDRRFITLLQTSDGLPTKFGLAHTEKWIAYLLSNALFIKTFDYANGERYPDLGCNFETFTNNEMLEIESLSPLRNLANGQSVEHTEHWYLFGGATEPHSLKQRELAEWLTPLLAQIDLAIPQ